MAESAAADTATSGRLDGATHVLPIRIYYEDTDAGGIVYHANYLKFAERARTEWMRLLGVSHSAILADTGIAFAVRGASLDFRRPARLDDVVRVRTRVLGVGGARLELEQVVEREGNPLAVITLTLVCVDRRLRAVRLPGPVRTILQMLDNSGGGTAAARQEEG